jgi:hypothetical protein
MKKKKFDVDSLLSLAPLGPSRWELDNIVWSDRTTNPVTLVNFLKRIQDLRATETLSQAEEYELTALEDLSDDLDVHACKALLSGDDETAQQAFIENIARQSALETLCNNQISIETMTAMCKLSPNDFILASKRGQDLINSIRELVIQGETLSDDIAGA